MKAMPVASRFLVRATTLAVAASLAFAQAAAAAQSFIRDTEIEADIRTMVTPIWKAAGLDPNALHVYLIDDKQLNSFVAGGQNEFINTGLIMRAQTPNQLIGVLAHETGHIAGGHLYAHAAGDDECQHRGDHRDGARRRGDGGGKRQRRRRSPAWAPRVWRSAPSFNTRSARKRRPTRRR